MRRSIIAGVGSYLPTTRAHQRRSGAAWSTPATSGSSSAPASASAASPPKARRPPTLALAAAAQALWPMPAWTRATIDLIVLATSTPGPDFPGDGATRPGRAWHHRGRGVRCPGRVLRLRLCAGHRRQFHQGRAGQSAPGHRRGDLLAHSRLEGPRHLRAVRRWRRRRGAARRRRRGHDRRSRHPHDPRCVPTAAITTSSMSMAARHRRRPSAICAWRAGKCSSTPSPTSRPSWRRRIDGGRHRGRRHRLVRAAPGQPAHPRRHGQEARHRAGEGGHRPLDRHGNTSAASIPLALDAAVKDGRIKRGDLVLMEAMGGGFTWGAALAR